MGIDNRLKVLLTTEGTYPFHQGGVSSWCHVLLDDLNSIDYIVYSIVMNPYVTQKFTLPSHSLLIRVPLWGTEDPSEHLAGPFSTVYTMKRNTNQTVIKKHFIPLFEDLISGIIEPNQEPLKFANTLLELHKVFRIYDYKECFKSELTWNLYKKLILSYTIDGKNKLTEPSIFDLIQSLGWIYRFLVVLNTPIPSVNVAHSTAAGFCGLPGVLAKLENNTPYLLTEHGVYLREQYLSLSRRGYSSFLTTFLIKMIHSIVSVNYALADQVSPVCKYNTRWEKQFGVLPQNIKVIYNGVDKDHFSPLPDFNSSAQLTVVSIARIDPVKDLLTLMKAAAIVRQHFPTVKFIVYGSVSVPAYYEECLALKAELGLDNFIFAGHTNDPPAAYRSGDIIALSSITEAFPYAAVEAMMTGKPIVATDVGGTGEAIGDCGLMVSPRKPEEFANALMKLLGDASLRHTLGREARDRALNHFAVERMLELYMNTYQQLNARTAKPEPLVLLLRQQLYTEKGYALAELGLWREATNQFRLAITTAADSAAVPILMLEIAKAYNNLGKFELAFDAMEKAGLLMEILHKKQAA